MTTPDETPARPQPSTEPLRGTEHPAPAAAQPAAGASGKEQLAAGARQMAGGAKQLYGAHLAPALKEGMDGLRSAGQQGAALSPMAAAQRLAGPALVAVSLLGLLALFLPVASFLGQSIGWFSDELANGEGQLMLGAVLLAAAAGVLAFFVRRRWAAIVAGILAIVIGIFAMVDGFGNIGRLQEASAYVSPGAGLYLLGISGLFMLLVGILLLIPVKRRQGPAVTAPLQH